MREGKSNDAEETNVEAKVELAREDGILFRGERSDSERREPSGLLQTSLSSLSTLLEGLELILTFS